MMTKTFRTPLAQLRKRHAILRSAAEIHDPRLFHLCRGELLLQHRKQIARMKTIPSLMSHSIESNIGQSRSSKLRVNPKGKDSLVGSAELPRASEDTTPVNPNRKPEGFAILEG